MPGVGRIDAVAPGWGSLQSVIPCSQPGTFPWQGTVVGAHNAKSNSGSRRLGRRAGSLQRKGVSLTGNACLGQNNDSLVEFIGQHCKAGDTIATKHPA